MDGGRPKIAASAILAVLRRPSLWVTAVRQMFRLAPNGWWRKAPFLPLPDERYLRFRLETQYGDAMHSTEPRDLLTYLAWCRSYQRDLRRRRARA
ncbi:MAG: hypothetical protein ACKOXX_06865 [Actinomycetota bacterium]